MNPDIERAMERLARACRDAEPCFDDEDVEEGEECWVGSLCLAAEDLLAELRRSGGR